LSHGASLQQLRVQETSMKHRTQDSMLWMAKRRKVVAASTVYRPQEGDRTTKNEPLAQLSKSDDITFVYQSNAKRKTKTIHSCFTYTYSLLRISIA